MQSEEQRLIDGLFGRLKEAETKTGQRDLQAEQQINQHIREQPSAPYYMAQAMIIQEAALKQLDQRVKDLESQVAQQQQNSANPPSSGGFLAGLFGGGNRSTPSPREQYQAQQQNNAAWNNQPQPGYAPQQQQPTYSQPQQAAPSRAGGFLGGALQTAAGVAGGVVLADMLTGMFRHSQPQEIVNIIDETPAAPVDDSAMSNFDASNNLDTFNGADNRFLNQDNGFQNADYQNDDNTDFSDDDYNDDDSFI
ncbi:DUF2076 domain-containing protein [Serratia proteamaculans]|uniref:DUF2076 domain-containing protein n=1 Tax=Serratia proteamaculans TaxID=28151 RepID=UPI001249DC80|nr:DUF2076 domain-containing protein [Serratia proteamaculans]KAB1497049.1 DUF2076 domain-containing protein [Serratia proteamaculans]CAI0890729.1 Uncharacterized protein conserved in bacteria (DUF2076) [Serratia proteamaculans]CAI0893965.1 Uncharacterized protein conserved in bacteria (DUF2076) [Serratia proteamaculans]CAI0960057.1 Uncharacterized protein conserved in bacteria (DUF2076) [Serratia proteamaculans]CAI0969005.1 Uncharacterized protein conserved in bacteria (DUF2076) [Serratia pro